MGFDLYFAGDKHNATDKYLRGCNANRLCSQLLHRPNIKDWCMLKSDDSKLFVDSGAYTAYTKGVTIDVDEYIEYLNSISAKVTLMAQLDTIPGRFNKPKTRKEIEERPEKSWINYLYMRSRLVEPEKLVPIFHQGEDYKWLRNMLDYRDENNKPIPYIGISPAIDVKGLDSFLVNSFRIIANSSNPTVKTHAFGMTQLEKLEMFPYTSADSTSWKLTRAMGSIYTPYGTVYVSDRNKYEKSYILNQPKEVVEKIMNYIETNGYSFKEVAESDVPRYIINVNYLLDWAKNYVYKGTSFILNKKLF